MERQRETEREKISGKSAFTWLGLLLLVFVGVGGGGGGCGRGGHKLRFGLTSSIALPEKPAMTATCDDDKNITEKKNTK